MFTMRLESHSGLRMAIITDGIYPFMIGGMQKHSFNLTKHLVQLGIDVTLFHCVALEDLPTHEQVLDAMGLQAKSNFKSVALRFPQIPHIPGHYLRESYLYSKKVFNCIDGDLNSFDLIYAKGFTAWRLLQSKRRFRGAPPIIVKFHGYEMFQKAPSFKVKLEHHLLRPAVKFNTRNADYVMSYGHRITQLIRELGVPDSKILEIPSGIESNWIRKAILSTSSVSRRFLFIGRYERRKGVEELNAVLRSLGKNYSFHFDFVGPIPFSNQLDDRRVTYHGQIMDKASLWRIMDDCEVLVTPSHSEGMPNVILEGMARGLAVIATDVGAVGALVDSSCGWLLSSCSTLELKSAMEHVLNLSCEELTEKRSNALELVTTNFNWNSIATRSYDTFERLVKKNVGLAVSHQ